MQLHDALEQISEIRTQIARTETFRGYRSATVAFSGVVALGAAGLQSLLIPEPTEHIAAWVTLWVAAALLALGIVAFEMVYRLRRAESIMSPRLTRLAVEQFLPCLLAGGGLTCVLLLKEQQSAWMLPGLWALLFSLGVFASWRLLTGPVVWVGAYYLIAGLACLAWGDGEAALSPWTMIGTFGAGQLLAAGVLYFTLECSHE